MENSKFLIQLNESQMTKFPVPNTKQGSIIVSSLSFREFFSYRVRVPRLLVDMACIGTGIVLPRTYGWKSTGFSGGLNWSFCYSLSQELFFIKHSLRVQCIRSKSLSQLSTKMPLNLPPKELSLVAETTLKQTT